MIINDLKKINLFLFDMDGTLYLGNTLFPFTKELLSKIKSSGKKYMFMTNNSSKSVADYVKKLDSLGIESTKDDFITSSDATIYYILNNFPQYKIYVCGTESLKKEFIDNGLSVTEKIEETECVVLGFDTELTFKKIEDVCKILLTKPDVKYIATNPDVVCPTEFGSVPDCGSLSEIIYNATGRKPQFIGKPSPLMPQLAMKKAGYGCEETAVFGDRIYTDVMCGINAGIKGILVMSGETTIDILNASLDKPDLVLEDCSEILKFL